MQELFTPDESMREPSGLRVQTGLNWPLRLLEVYAPAHSVLICKTRIYFAEPTRWGCGEEWMKLDLWSALSSIWPTASVAEKELKNFLKQNKLQVGQNYFKICAICKKESFQGHTNFIN